MKLTDKIEINDMRPKTSVNHRWSMSPKHNKSIPHTNDRPGTIISNYKSTEIHEDSSLL